MQMFEFAAILGVLGFVAFALRLAASPRPRPGAWRVPAALCAAFLAFSLYAVAAEGLVGFWPIHSRTAWGNQVWFDLLLAAGVALAFMIPEARRQGMNPWPWTFLVMATGSIGLLAMAARIQYLKEAGVSAKAPVTGAA